MTENVVTRAVYRPLWSDDESSMWSDEESVQGVSVRSSPAKLTRSPLRRTPTKQRSPLAVLSPNKPVEAAAAPAAAAKARGRFRDPATPVFRQQIQANGPNATPEPASEASTPFLTPQFVAAGASTVASTPAAFGSPQETLEEQAAAETAVLKERVAVLEAENESLRHAVDSVTDEDVDAHHSQLVLSLKRELAELRAEKGTQMSDAKQQLAACEALATSLKQDLTSAEAAAAAARVEAERHRAIANRLSAANDAMQAQLSAALEPADSNASAAPEEATVEQESAEESAEARITADGGKIVKKVLWDVNKLQKENAALLEAVATQAAHRETLQAQVAELKRQLVALPELQKELHASRAENYSLACQLRAALQRLEAALSEDASLRLQLADQRDLVEQLDAACKDACGNDGGGNGGGGGAGKAVAAAKVEADVLERLRGMAATVQKESSMDCSPVVARLTKEFSQQRGAAPASADDDDTMDVGGAWAKLSAAEAAVEAAEEERTHLQSRVAALEASVEAAAAAAREASVREGTEHAAHGAEVKQLKREVAQVHVWLDEALSKAEDMRRQKDALKRKLATAEAVTMDEARTAALMQEQTMVTRKQDEMLQVGRARVMQLEGDLAAVRVELCGKSEALVELRTRHGTVRDELAAAQATLQQTEQRCDRAEEQLAVRTAEAAERKKQLQDTTAAKTASEVQLGRTTDALTAARAKVGALEVAAAATEAELKKTKDQLAMVRAQASKLSAKHREDHDQLLHHGNEAHDAAARIGRLTAELEAALMAKAAAEVEVGRLKVMAEELSHARAETESELASERALATAATSSVKQLTRANAELEAAATAANERCEAVREEAGRWSTQAQQVYGTVAEMEKAHVTMQTQLDNATAAAAQAREEAAAAEGQTNELLHALATERLKNEDFAAELRSVKEAAEAARRDVRRAEEQAAAAATAVRDVQSLRAASDGYEAEICRLEARVAEMEQEVREARAEVSTVGRVRQEAAKWEQNATAVNDKAETLQASKVELEAALVTANAVAREATEAAERWESEASEARQRCVAAEVTCAEAQAEVDALRAQVTEAREAAAALSADTATAAQRAEAEATRAAGLQERTELTNKEMADVYTQLEASLRAQSTMQSTLQHLETKAHALTETVRQLKEANRMADEQLAAARRERVDALGVQGELKAAALTAEGRAAAAEASAKEAQAAAARAVEHMTELQTTLSHSQQAAASLEALKQTAEVTAEAEGKRAHAAAAAAQEAQEALASQEATVRRAAEEASAAKEAVLSWRARAAKDRTKLQALTARLHEKDAQVEALHTAAAAAEQEWQHRARLQALAAVKDAAGAVPAEDAATLQQTAAEAQRRCDELHRVHEHTLATLTTAQAERDALLQEREALVGQGEQLQTAADAAQRALDTERSKRQTLAEEMYQRERIVQMLCSENEELKDRIRSINAKGGNVVPVNCAVPPTPWTDRVIATLRTGTALPARHGRTPLSPTRHWEAPHELTACTPAGGDGGMDAPSPVRTQPTVRSFAFASEIKRRAPGGDEMPLPPASVASDKVTPVWAAAGLGASPGLSSLKSELDANQKLIALIESRMEAESESRRSSLTSSPAQPPAASRRPRQQPHPQATQTVPTQTATPAPAHSLQRRASSNGEVAAVHAGGGGELSLTCSPTGQQLHFQREAVQTDDATVGSWAALHLGVASSSAATTPAFGIPGPNNGTDGDSVGHSAPDSARSAGTTMSGLEALFSPVEQAAAAQAPPALSLNAAVGKAKKYKSHAKLLHAKLQEQAALYQRVCLVYEDELRRAHHGKGTSPVVASPPVAANPLAPAPKCLLSASPLQPSTPPLPPTPPELAATARDAAPPGTPEEWRLFRASMQSSGGDGG